MKVQLIPTRLLNKIIKSLVNIKNVYLDEWWKVLVKYKYVLKYEMHKLKHNYFYLFIETHVCPTTHFKCANYFCIPTDKACDFKDDCGDGSDELQCS